MGYTGKHFSRFSRKLNKNVSILEYKSNDKVPYCDCDMCGKPIVRTMYVVQDPETDIEMMYVGSDCVKKV